MKRLLKASTMTGGSSLFNLLASAARVKIVALLVGTAGVGVIAYLVNFVQLAVSVTTLGMGSGIVKLTSEFSAQDDETEVNRLKATAFSTTFWFSILVTIVLLIASRQISILLMGSADYTLYVRLISLSIPFTTLSQGLTSVLNGYRAIRELALITLWSAVISLAIVAPLVWRYRVTGVVWHFLLQSIVLLMVGVAYYRWTMKDSRILPFLSLRRFDRQLMKKLGAFGVATFLIGVFQNLSFLFVRRLIQAKFGEHGVGLYQVPYGLTLQYLNIVLTALLTYSLPTMSALREESLLREELNQTLKASLMVIVPIIAALLVLRKYLILLLFSHAFLPSAGLLEIQLIGDFFKVIAFVFGVAVLARAHLKAWLIFDLLWDGVFVLSTVLLLGQTGLSGVAFAFVIAYGVMALAYALFVRRRMNLSLTRSNVKLIVISLVALLLIGTASHEAFLVALVVAPAILLLWVVLCFQKSEIKSAWALARRLAGMSGTSLPLP